jgi:4-amino-4-deoxy-L-arabinose transferase-like glycosyltransferase
VEPFYPPFYHLSLIPLSLIFGFTLDTGVIGNSFYMVILVLSTYGVGKILYSKNVGLVSAFLVSFYPLIVSMAREYIISVMLTAMTSLAYYLFLKSNNFEDKKYSLLFSFIFASGLMVKWTFFIYILPAILAGLWGKKINFKDRLIQFTYYFGMIFALLMIPFFIFILDAQKWIPLILEFLLIGALLKNFPKASISPQKAINLISLSCISVLICFPWYAHNLINILIGMSKFAFPSSVLKGGMAWDLPIWGFYLEVISRQMGYPLLSIFAVTFLFYLFKKEQFNWTLFGWAILPIIAFTFVNNKGARYTMPTLPAMAMITSVVLTQVQSISFRKFLYAITGVTTLVTALYSGFTPKPSFIPYLGITNLPITQSWSINLILNDIIGEKNRKKINIFLFVPWQTLGTFKEGHLGILQLLEVCLLQ